MFPSRSSARTINGCFRWRNRPTRTTFQFPAQGFFDVRRANGREELAAVNPDRRESDFAIVPTETLQLWKNTGIASKQAPGDEFRHE